MPDWDAVIVQVPIPVGVTVVPASEHTEGGVEAKLTVNEELAVAESAKGAEPTARLGSEPKVMLCAVSTVKLRDTGNAGR